MGRDIGYDHLVRLGAVMYLAGAVLGTGTLLLPGVTSPNLVATIAIAAVCVTTGLTMWVLGSRLPRWCLHLTTGGSALVIAYSHVSSSLGQSDAFLLLYVWVAVFAAFAFPHRGAQVHALLAGVLGAGAVHVRGGDPLLDGAVVATTALVLVFAIQTARARSARLLTLVEHGVNVVLVCDTEGRIRHQSAPGRQLRDARREHLRELVHHDDAARFGDALRRVQQPPSHELSLRGRFARPDGSWVETETTVVDQRHEQAVAGLVLYVRDVTERLAFEERLHEQAFHDPLTGLPNRALLADRVQHAVERTDRLHQPVSVLLLDLDDFKEINDTLGHAVGDELLCTLAQRLVEEVRPSDTVARLGGDEFALLLEETEDPQEVLAVAERLLRRLAEPVRLDDRVELSPRASIGVVRSGSSHDRAEDLLRDADAAMYQAKEQGGHRVVRFAPEMHEPLLRRLRVRSDLERGIARRELTLRYQPVVRLADEQIVGVEALVRWQHPELGLVAPLDFITVAEETGLIVPLGRFVLHAACDQLAAWDAAGATPLHMQVNVSGRQLEQPGFAEEVAAALRRTGLAPDRLTLEVTESVLLHDLDSVAERLAELKAVGVQLAIDDFGTGYASLGSLRDHPFDCVKVDRTFVDAMATSESSAALVQSIVALAQSLQLSCVAEGVEDRDQVRRLRELNCAYAQGYLYSRPVEPAELHAQLMGEAVAA